MTKQNKFDWPSYASLAINELLGQKNTYEFKKAVFDNYVKRRCALHCEINSVPIQRHQAHPD